MEKIVQVTRIYPATISQVWAVWTEPELVKRWWGPNMFTCPLARIDFREGGVSLVAMQAPEQMGNVIFYNIWEYKKIIPQQRIEMIQNLADAAGNRVKPTQVNMPADFPEDVFTVITFKDLGDGKTEMTVTEHADFGQMSHFAQLGLEQCLDKIGNIFA